MAFLAGLLNLPVFVPSNLAVLQAGPWSAGAGAVAVADVCECVCRRHDTIPPPACPSVQVRSSTRLWCVSEDNGLPAAVYPLPTILHTVQGVECGVHSTGPPPAVTLMQLSSWSLRSTRNTTNSEHPTHS